ncbi:MAG TPA: endonuclease III [Thermomicrobiales bacterium]|nr:endonuclease III [Thermomicrobiales bacterium]
MAFSAIDHLDEVERILDETYGPRKLRPSGDPVGTLVSTILSQNTSDINTECAYASLRARFPTWDAVVKANTDEVIDAIRSGGLANRKAPRIQEALDEIRDRYGEFSLDQLATIPLEEAKDTLLSIDGVGPKTAACVLLFALGRPALPVDTHVYRVSKRLGLIDDATTPVRAHATLEALMEGDADRTYRFHVEMIAHGRTICTARNPKCHICPLRSYCEYAATHAT